MTLELNGDIVVISEPLPPPPLSKCNVRDTRTPLLSTRFRNQIMCVIVMKKKFSPTAESHASCTWTSTTGRSRLAHRTPPASRKGSMGEDSRTLSKEDLEQLLRPTLDAEGATIKDFSVRYLTKPGDNYGSTMLAVDVNLTPGDRTLPLVAKMLPKSTGLQEVFQCETTVRKEIDLYQLVRPAYERMQKENHVPQEKFVDVIPLCHGARISAKGDSGPVDKTSVILQENLKAQGFECGDRFVGLNLAHCKLVIDNLARFHAIGVAMKIKKPDEFKRTMLRVAVPLKLDNSDPTVVIAALENIPEYETMKERINTALMKSFELFTNVFVSPPRELFATITHLDLWTNNILFRYGTNSSKDNPTSVKIVDYQIIQYDSPARDLIFFIYSSAKVEVINDHYDYLVRLYYDSFVDCLSLLGCDISPFTFEEFLKEIDYASGPEFYHLGFMLPAINLPAEYAKSTEDMTFEDMKTPWKCGESYYPRGSKYITDFASRNWI